MNTITITLDVCTLSHIAAVIGVILTYLLIGSLIGGLTTRWLNSPYGGKELDAFMGMLMWPPILLAGIVYCLAYPFYRLSCKIGGA